MNLGGGETLLRADIYIQKCILQQLCIGSWTAGCFFPGYFGLIWVD